ncbi:MAG: energy-coupling factor ABC transporter ATP-binding protein [Methanoregula sp.]|nr:energy-coupling factor ABC transporter ATP-binding protein [Methanoregula sp.]
MISLRSLRHQVLDIPSLDIQPGITSVIGPNGSGKTTLLKCCAGIAEPSAGTVLVDGHSPRETETGWVNEFPDRNILFETVADEVASPLRFRRVSCEMISSRVDHQLGVMGIIHLRDRAVRDLSGGEKILVALAAALVHSPHVLVLDEYDSHLDAGRARAIDDILRSGRIPYVIRCTQQMETAALGDRIVYLENGRAIHHGSPPEVFSSLSGSAFYPLSLRCGT